MTDAAREFQNAVADVRARRDKRMLRDLERMKAAAEKTLSKQEAFEAIVSAMAVLLLDEWRLLVAFGNPLQSGKEGNAAIISLLRAELDSFATDMGSESEARH